MAFFNVQKVCCTTEVELTKNTQAKLYGKIKKVVDTEGYCLASVSHKDRDAFELVTEKVLQKLKVYIPSIEKTDNHASHNHRNHPTCRGVAKMDRLPEEALMLQSSPAMIAIFQELLGSKEIYNAFDVPQVVMPGENQSYKGLAVEGNPYVCLLTMTRQDVGEHANQMTVPVGTLIIYDALRAPSIMPRNPANSHPWYGIRITYWTQSIFDRATRNTIYLTGAFGLYVATDTRRKIQQRREFLLKMGEEDNDDDDARREIVRKTCIYWNKEKDIDIGEMKKETEQLIAKGEPFPQQFVVDGNKLSGGGRQRRRCFHPDCLNNNQEYANINQHVRLMHNDEKRQIPKSCPHPDCQNRPKQYVNVKLHMTMKHMPQNETCTRMKRDDEQEEEEDNAVRNVATKRNVDERDDEKEEQQEEEEEYDYNKKFKSTKKVTFATPLVHGRRNRLSLGKKYKVTSEMIPATQRHDIDELEEALREMNSFGSPLSPLHPSPPRDSNELKSALREMYSIDSPLSPLHPSPPEYKERDDDDDAMEIGEAFTEMKNNSIQFSPQLSLGEYDEEDDSAEYLKKYTQTTTMLPSTMSEGSKNKKVHKLGLRHDDRVDNLDINLVNLPPPPPPEKRREQRSEKEKWPKLIPVSHVKRCPYGRPLREMPVSIPLSPQMAHTFDQCFEEGKKPRDHNQNQAISHYLDKLDEVLKSAREGKSIDTEDDYVDPDPRKRKRKPTKAEDDQLYPLTSILMDHPSFDERDSYDYEDDDENSATVRTPDTVLEEIPKHLHLQYDVWLEENSVIKAECTNVWIYKRAWMLEEIGTREHYISKLVFCDATYLKGRFPTPALMKTDEEYRHRRCYIRTKSENKVYEIRGANTVMDVVRIFYHGIRKVNEKGRRRREQPYCFMLCDTELALQNATENEVYCVKRVPLFLAAKSKLNQQYMFYPKPFPNEFDVKLDYVPDISAMEEALPCGLSSVVTIPKEKKERVRILSNFLEDKFKLRYPGMNVSSKKCKELAKELLDMCNNIDPTFEIDMPADLDGVIKKHKEGRTQIIRYAMDALIDNKMKDNSLKRIKRVAMEQCLIMRDIAKLHESVLSRIYKKTDYFGEGDILLLGIVVYDEQFTAGLRELDRKGEEIKRLLQTV